MGRQVPGLGSPSPLTPKASKGTKRQSATLRAVLHKRRDVLKSVFTGSSQQAMVRMLSAAGSPMVQFAQLLDFPVLGDEFLQQLGRHFAEVHPRKLLPLEDLRRVFARIGFKPGLMRDLVKSLSTEGFTDVEAGVKRFLLDDRQVAGWSALLQPHDLFERAVLLAIAQGLPPMGREALDALAKVQGSLSLMPSSSVAAPASRHPAPAASGTALHPCPSSRGAAAPCRRGRISGASCRV